MSFSPTNRFTPWVIRLIIANAVVLLLRMTLFTSPEIVQAISDYQSGRMGSIPATHFGAGPR